MWKYVVLFIISLNFGVSISFQLKAAYHNISRHYDILPLNNLQSIMPRHIAQVVPVIFVCFGPISEVVLFAAELAARSNIVLVVSDQLSQIHCVRTKHQIFYIPMKNFELEAVVFASYYKPVRLKHSEEFESRCIRRWFIVKALSKLIGLRRFFYADNDVAVFSNMTRAFEFRSRCGAVVSVEGDHSEQTFLAFASGHSSLWTHEAIDDFCAFVMALYEPSLHTALTLVGIPNVSLKKGVNRVVDMTLLWLWWVAHHRPGHGNYPTIALHHGNASVTAAAAGSGGGRGEEATVIPLKKDHIDGWSTGRPLQAAKAKTLAEMRAVRLRHDQKLRDTLSHFSLPSVRLQRLTVCNGLDIVHRTVFDHIHGYFEPNFSLNVQSIDDIKHSGPAANDVMSNSVNSSASIMINSHDSRFIAHAASGGGAEGNDLLLLPYFIGVSSMNGGIPEQLNKSFISDLQLHSAPVTMLTLHYQSNHKMFFKYDICRVLLSVATFDHYIAQRERGGGVSSAGEVESLLHSFNGSVRSYLLHQISDDHVRQQCDVISLQSSAVFPKFERFPLCYNHEVDINKPAVCI